jgi:hypothetical protein
MNSKTSYSQSQFTSESRNNKPSSIMEESSQVSLTSSAAAREKSQTMSKIDIGNKSNDFSKSNEKSKSVISKINTMTQEKSELVEKSFKQEKSELKEKSLILDKSGEKKTPYGKPENSSSQVTKSNNSNLKSAIKKKISPYDNKSFSSSSKSGSHNTGIDPNIIGQIRGSLLGLARGPVDESKNSLLEEKKNEDETLLSPPKRGSSKHKFLQISWSKTFTRKKIKVKKVEEGPERDILNFKNIDDSLGSDEYHSEEEEGKFLMEQNAYFKQFFDNIILLSILYSCTVAPYLIAFSIESPFLNTVETLMDVFFLIEIAINFITPYNVGEKEIRGQSKIAMHYFRTRFFVDMISSIPNSFLSGLGVKNLKSTRLLKISRMYKLVRWVSTLNFSKSGGSEKADDSSMERIFKFLIFFVVLTHISTCVWIYLGMLLAAEGSSWLTFFSQQDEAFSDIYVCSLYYNIVTIFTVGYGDFRGTNNSEYIYLIFFMFISTMMYSFGVSAMSTIFLNLSNFQKIFSEKLKVLDSIVEKNPIPPELYNQIKSSLKFSKEASEQKFEFLDTLPYALKKEVLIGMTRRKIKSLNFFKNQSRDFVIFTLPMLHSMKVLRGETLISDGEFVEEMFIVKRGLLSIRLGEKFDRVEISQLREKDHFGELFMYINENSQFMVSGRSSLCDLFTITKHNYTKIKMSYSDIILTHLSKSCIFLERIERLKNIVSQLYEMGLNMKRIKQFIKRINFFAFKEQFQSFIDGDGHYDLEEVEDFILNNDLADIWSFLQSPMNEFDFLKCFYRKLKFVNNINEPGLIKHKNDYYQRKNKIVETRSTHVDLMLNFNYGQKMSEAIMEQQQITQQIELAKVAQESIHNYDETDNSQLVGGMSFLNIAPNENVNNVTLTPTVEQTPTSPTKEVALMPRPSVSINNIALLKRGSTKTFSLFDRQPTVNSPVKKPVPILEKQKTEKAKAMMNFTNSPMIRPNMPLPAMLKNRGLARLSIFHFKSSKKNVIEALEKPNTTQQRSTVGAIAGATSYFTKLIGSAVKEVTSQNPNESVDDSKKDQTASPMLNKRVSFNVADTQNQNNQANNILNILTSPTKTNNTNQKKTSYLSSLFKNPSAKPTEKTNEQIPEEDEQDTLKHEKEEKLPFQDEKKFKKTNVMNPRGSISKQTIREEDENDSDDENIKNHKKKEDQRMEIIKEEKSSNKGKDKYRSSKSKDNENDRKKSSKSKDHDREKRKDKEKIKYKQTDKKEKHKSKEKERKKKYVVSSDDESDPKERSKSQKKISKEDKSKEKERLARKKSSKSGKSRGSKDKWSSQPPKVYNIFNYGNNYNQNFIITNDKPEDLKIQENDNFNIQSQTKRDNTLEVCKPITVSVIDKLMKVADTNLKWKTNEQLFTDFDEISKDLIELDFKEENNEVRVYENYYSKNTISLNKNDFMTKRSNILSKLMQFTESTNRFGALEHVASQITQKKGGGPGRIFKDQLRHNPEVFENLTITSSENFNSQAENSQILSSRGITSRLFNSRETSESNLEEPRNPMVFDYPDESRIQSIRGEMMHSIKGESIIPSIRGESIINSIRGESMDFIDDMSLRRSLSRKNINKSEDIKNTVRSRFDNKETLSNKFEELKSFRSKSGSPEKAKTEVAKKSSSKFALQKVTVYEDIKQGSSIISPVKNSSRGSKMSSPGKYDNIKSGSLFQSKVKYENIKTGSVVQSVMKSKAVYENIKSSSKIGGSQFLGSQIVLKTKHITNEEPKEILQEKLTIESKKLTEANPLSTTKSHKEDPIHTEEKKSKVSTVVTPDEDKATQKSNRSEEERKVLRPAQEKKYELGDKMAIESKSREMIFQEVTKGLYIDEMFHSNKHFLKDKISNVLDERKEVKKAGYAYLRKLDNMLLFLKEVAN